MARQRREWTAHHFTPGAETKGTASLEGVPTPGAPSFELSESKLLAPQGVASSVSRTALIERLQRSRKIPVVVIAAGPGYGKTTLLSQWASRSRRPFAWLALDEGDNDPVVFLTYVAAALNRASPLGPGIFDALASPSDSSKERRSPGWGPRSRRCRARSSDPRRSSLAGHRQCLDAVDEFIRYLPPGFQLALSTRGEPSLSIGKEGPRQWSWNRTRRPEMGGDEARQLLRRCRGEGRGRGAHRPDRAHRRLGSGPLPCGPLDTVIRARNKEGR